MSNHSRMELPSRVDISTNTQEPEATSREKALRIYIDRHVLKLRTPDAAKDAAKIAEGYRGLSPREKSDLLYGKLMAYHDAVEIIRQEKKENPQVKTDPVDPYLVEEIAFLWENDDVKRIVGSTYSAARVEIHEFRLSELGRDWQRINAAIEHRRYEFEGATQQLFLRKSTRPDKVSATQGKTERLARELIDLKAQRENIISLKIKGRDDKDLPLVKENTDIAAQIMYEQLGRYHDQLTQDGFVWLPSRDDIHTRTIEALQNGRWPVLKGEAGTGKSEQADAAAVALTNEQPTHLACGPNTSARELIADRDIDEATGGSYEKFGEAMQAATGYIDSRQKEPSFKTGRIVRLDESGRLGPKGYSEIKELRQKRPANPKDVEQWSNGKQIDVGKLLHGKPVLPGFAAILTTNPVGARYPDRTEPDPALRREVADILVDYPPMSHNDPELYEFMLSALMDQNRHIPISEKELAPAYVRVDFPEEQQGLLEDSRRVLGKDLIIEDPTDPKHGLLYRLSFATRSLQDAFIYGNGNTQSIPDNALRYIINNDGKIVAQKDTGDLLTLTSSTITLGEVTSWMTGFHERTLKDDPEFQTRTLTEWIQLKLQTYLNQVDQDDKEKIEAIFKYYNLFAPPPELANGVPITPMRIGYLSPRVPKPWYISESLDPNIEAAADDKESRIEEVAPQPEVYQNVKLMLEDGASILVNPEPVTLNMKEE